VDRGLWKSDNGGVSWQHVGEGIAYPMVMSVAVSRAERGAGGYGVVWAGTEPSALYRSEDGGETWQDCPTLLDLPSRPTWKFPPRPYTHHVRWIQPDPIDANRIAVAIELGGVMRSLDKGRTWEDYKPASQRDGHTLAMHPRAPGRIYEAAGGEAAVFRPKVTLSLPPVQPQVVMRAGGYAESRDGGATWETLDDGLDGNHYLWGVAVDPGDPDTVVASGASGPVQAHQRTFAETYLLRRTAGQPWQRVRDGLPEARGTMISVLATNESEPGVFYAANNRGVFRSVDAGISWQALPLAWPERYRTQHLTGITAMA
jgi:hypothetical protein